MEYYCVLGVSVCFAVCSTALFAFELSDLLCSTTSSVCEQAAQAPGRRACAARTRRIIVTQASLVKTLLQTDRISVWNCSRRFVTNNAGHSEPSRHAEFNHLCVRRIVGVFCSAARCVRFVNFLPDDFRLLAAYKKSLTFFAAFRE